MEIVEHEIHKLYPIIYIHHYSYTKYDLNTVFMGSTPTTDLISSGINHWKYLKEEKHSEHSLRK
jgi:hypothetical protein